MEAVNHLKKLNRGLSRRALDLAASNRQLTQEISRRKLMEATLRKSEKHARELLKESRLLHGQLQFLSRRILTVQEEERKRISRELHDVIAQMLTGINVRLANLKAEAATNTRDIEKSITQTQHLVEQSADVVHQFACELRPASLSDLGLISALQAFLKGFNKKTGIHVHLTAYAGVEKLDGATSTPLYRIAHEALANVALHSQASRAEVCLRKHAGKISMDISDNGKGFNVKRFLCGSDCKRLGLLGIRERVEMLGGTLTIKSTLGKGTILRVEIPYQPALRPVVIKGETV
jgi:signal transduction histidine kinase